MAAWQMVVDAGRPGHSRLKLTSPSPTRPVPFLKVSGLWRQSLPIYPSASQRCVSCFRAFAVPLPACGLKLGQMFPELLRVDVSLLPQEAGVSRCYKKEGSRVEGCVILSCRGKQRFATSQGEPRLESCGGGGSQASACYRACSKGISC